jgi:hypothetical protein
MSAARLGERWESPISAMQSKAERRRNLARSPIVFVIAQEPFAFVWTIGIERRRRREYRGRTLINPSVASQGEMWTMLMQMIPSAEAIGDASVQIPKFRTASRRT